MKYGMMIVNFFWFDSRNLVALEWQRAEHDPRSPEDANTSSGCWFNALVCIHSLRGTC